MAHQDRGRKSLDPKMSTNEEVLHKMLPKLILPAAEVRTVSYYADRTCMPKKATQAADLVLLKTNSKVF